MGEFSLIFRLRNYPSAGGTRPRHDSAHGERLDICAACAHLSSERWVSPGLLAGGPAPVCAPGHAALQVSRTLPESSQGKEDTMLLGIDYGTTRTVVAAVDRGNYPVISFHTADGDTQDWYPSLI